MPTFETATLMSMPDDLDAILVRVPADIAAETRKLVTVLSVTRPDLVAKVQPGWGSVNYRHKRAGFICAVFPMADHVSLVFEHGRQLSNDDGLLEGDGKQVRFIRLAAGRSDPGGSDRALAGGGHCASQLERYQGPTGGEYGAHRPSGA